MFKNKSMVVVSLIVAMVLRTLGIIVGGGAEILYILTNEIWFIGMCLSVSVYRMGVDNGLIDFLLGLVACCYIIMLTEKWYSVF